MLSSQEAYAQIFLSEDFRTLTHTSDRWPCKNLPNAITTATFNGWMGEGFLVDNSPYNGGKLSGLSTAIYHSAPRSYYQHRPAEMIVGPSRYFKIVTSTLPDKNTSKVLCIFHK